jgi:Zn-dependent protease
MWGDRGNVTYRVSFQPQEHYIGVPQKGVLKFSKKEKMDLLLAIGALTLAFALWLYSSNIPFYLLAIMAFCAVMTGFFLHEVAHKYMAQKYGSWAEFRAWPLYLLIAIATAFFGVILAMPGAVYHKGYLTKEQTGKVSAAGPVINTIIASIILPVILFVPGIPFEVGVLLWMVFSVNVIIGCFNLVPFFGLDGTKIIKWNILIWLGLCAILGFYAVIVFFPRAIFG